MYRKIGMPKHVEMAGAPLGGCNLPPATSITRYLEYGNVCLRTHCAVTTPRPVRSSAAVGGGGAVAPAVT